MALEKNRVKDRYDWARWTLPHLGSLVDGKEVSDVRKILNKYPMMETLHAREYLV